MADSMHVKGLDELQKLLDTLPAKLERNVMRGALRAGMKTIQPVAQRNVHSVSGELAAGLKVGTQAKGGKVIAYLRATGPHAFIAKFVEFGTAAHDIAAKAKKGWLNFFGIFAKSVRHPGAKKKPFMRPALDQQAQAATIAAAEYIKKRLATKAGLDTSDIVIEGDE